VAIREYSIGNASRLPRVSVSPGLISTFIVGCTLVTWIAALPDTDISQMNDYGLISVLSPFALIALAILSISFCVNLRQEYLRTSIMLLHVGALVVMLFGVTSIVEPVPRFESTWKHVGVADYVIRHGSVDPNIDAYFNWPGFFILLAFVTEATGVKSVMSLANWTPVVSELAYLAPLLMIFRRATRDHRLIWLAVWTFYLANWIGQDYLSPQGLNYFFYLVIIAILLNWFEVTSDAPHPLIRLAARARVPTRLIARLYKWIAPADLPQEVSTRGQRWALGAIVIVMFVVVTAGHQLTPYAILAAAILLVLTYRCTFIPFPVIGAVIAFVWLKYVASTYWAGHSSEVTSQVGALGSSMGSNMTDRMAGSRGHQIVVYIRTAMTVALLGVAVLGGLRRLSKGHRDFTFAVLAVAPFPLVAAQSYGGEMLLRVYLFSLPFMAFFVAAIFYRSDEAGGSWKTTGAIILTSIVAIGLFYVTRYGNERQDYFSNEEVVAAEFLYENAEEGSIILTGTVKAPWKYRDYELHKHRSLSENVEWDEPDAYQPNLYKIEEILADDRYTAGYLFITRSQVANDEMFGLLPYGLSDLEVAIAESPDFTLIYENPDARIYVLTDQYVRDS
jgi:hypothetical protein